MTNRDIIKTTEHRPYALPKVPWMMKQIWHDLLFAHWPVNANDFKSLIPHGLELELWGGKPWISIVPFHMSGVRLRGFPPIPFTSRFPELNVRTYVTYQGKPGVYFFSLDATNRLAIETARALFHLPYMKARISVEREGDFIRYHSERKDLGRQMSFNERKDLERRMGFNERKDLERRMGFNEPTASFSGKYRAIDTKVFHAEPGTLIHWLTERYCLYTANSKGQILIGEIHHLPWNLQKAELQTEVNSMAKSHGIELPEEAPLLTYTKRLEVLIWPLKKV